MIFIIGDGHLGRYIAGCLSRTCVITRKRIAEFEPQKGDIIINAAAKTDLAWCEAHKKEAHQTNTVDAVDLATACADAGARLIHLSSGCIWDGPYRWDGEPFGPTDPPSPASYYAKTKAQADELISKIDELTYAILRLRMPYSPIPGPRNLFDKLKVYPKLIADPNTITSADTLVKTVNMLVSEPRLPLWRRISCVYDRGVTTPLDIGRLLYRRGIRRQMPEPLAKADLDEFHKPKRVSTVMKDDIFEAVVGPPEVDMELERVSLAYAMAAP